MKLFAIWDENGGRGLALYRENARDLIRGDTSDRIWYLRHMRISTGLTAMTRTENAFGAH